MLSTDEFIISLEQLGDPSEQRRLIEREAAWLTTDTVQQMKARANDWLASDMGRGIALADNIIYASQVSGQPIYRALGLMVQANAAKYRGDYHRALELYEEARQIACSVGNEVEAARSQVGRVGTMASLGQYLQALEIAQEVGPILLRHNEAISAATTYMNAGICYSHLGQPQQALAQYKISQEILEKAGSGTPTIYRNLRNVFYNIGLISRNMGRFGEALDYFARAIEIAELLDLKIEKAIYQQGTASCYYLMGDYNKALRILHDARAVFETNGHFDKLADCERFISGSYLELGRYEEVVERTRSLLDLLSQRQLSRTFHSALAYIQMGWALLSLTELDEAARFLQTAQAIADELGLSNFKQNSGIGLVRIYLLQGDYDRAAEMLNELLSLPDNANILATARLLLAQVAIKRGDPATARDEAHKALTALEAQGVWSGFDQAYSQLAEISEIEGDLPTALLHTERSLEHLESLRGRIASETRSTFLRSKETIYETGVVLSLGSDQSVKAFNLAERVKSRVLAELVGNGIDIRLRVRDEADRPLVEEAEGLRRRHNELTFRLARRPTDENELKLSEADRRDLTDQLHECEKQLAWLTEQLQVRNARYTEDVTLARPPSPFDLSLLAPHEVLVEYYVARGELLAFVATRQGVQTVRRLATLGELNRLLSFFRLNLAGTVKTLNDAASMSSATFTIRSEGLITNSQVLLQKLHTTLIKPLADLLRDYKHLLIVPHGSLHYLPFHALYNPVNRRYLLEDFEEITYLPAASLLRFCRERAGRSAAQGALVMGFSNGGALPCTGEEARQVANILGCEVHLEDAASLPRFQAEAANKKIIHLATHGQYRADSPLFSSLLLAEGDLTGHELFNMELQASLVTLSACESGLGTVGGGDELMGLSRACLYAGASSLALSQWRVEDQAGSTLMQEFYRQLLDGRGKSAALRQAQLSLLNNPKYRHPFYWATFILIGDNGPL